MGGHKGGLPGANDNDANTIPTTWCTIWAPLSIILGLICLVFNSITLIFYKNRRKKTLPLLYMGLSICDFIAGIAALLSGVTIITLTTGTQDLIFLGVSTTVTAIVSHVSVFMNLTVVVVRTINMIWPFYTPKNNILKCSLILYAAIWVVFTIFEQVKIPGNRL